MLGEPYMQKTGRKKKIQLRQPVKDLAISLRAKGEGQMKAGGVLFLLSVIFRPHLQRACFRSSSNRSLEASSTLLFSRLWLLPPFLFARNVSLPADALLSELLLNFFSSIVFWSSVDSTLCSPLCFCLFLFPKIFFSPASSPYNKPPSHTPLVDVVDVCCSLVLFTANTAFLPVPFWLTWYLVGCFLDFLWMNSSPGCG